MAVDVIEFLLAGFTDLSGEPLAAGKVYTYEAGTTTPKDTFVDEDGDTAGVNPIILDAVGRAQRYAEGAYKFVIKTTDDVLLYTFDNINFGTLGAVSFGGTSSGSANVYVISPTPAPAAYNDGDLFSFKAHQTNLSTATLNAGAGAKTLTTIPGQIVKDETYLVSFDDLADRFVLVNPDPAEVSTQAEMAALNTAGVGEIIVREPITMTGNLTLTVPLRMLPGAMITTGSYTLTINGGFTAPKKKVFITTSTVVFGQNSVSEVLPEWFGALADNSTDNHLAFTAAIASLPTYGKLKLGAGIYQGWIPVHRSFVEIEGCGSNITTIKIPDAASYTVNNELGIDVTGTPICLDLGTAAKGNLATAVTNIKIKGLSLNGNRANQSLPPQDIFGIGIILTNANYCHVSDVYVYDFLIEGIANVINSNYNYIQGLVVNCGEATFGFPGCDINSSKYGHFDIIAKDCNYGMRVLDNCWGNTVNLTAQNCTLSGFLVNNQAVNTGVIDNLFNVTVEDGCSNDGVQVGVKVFANIFNITVRNVDGGGVQIVEYGVDANEPCGNIFTIATYGGQKQALSLGGNNNTVKLTSFLDGRSGAPGDYYAAMILGDRNILELDVIDSAVFQYRALSFSASSNDNQVLRYSHTATGVLADDSGTRNRVNFPEGQGAPIASASGINVPNKGNFFNITGTTNINSITSAQVHKGRLITLVFDGILTLSDGSNLKLAGNFVTTADDTISLRSDGTNWIEVCRSVN